MKIPFLAIPAVFVFASFATATEEDAHGKAIELMKLMEMRENIDSSMSQVEDFSVRMIEAQGLDPEAEKMAIETSRSSMRATTEAMREMDWEGIFAEIYAEVFTADEIQGLIDFYSSPVGQKLLEKQPQLTAATMRRMQAEMAKIMPKVQEATREAIEKARSEQAGE